MGIARVVERFGLGRLMDDPVRVPGGLSNELWRVRTTAGDFAVKRMVVNAHRPEFVDNVEAAFGVEWRAWNSGVPMPEPMPVDGQALLRDGGDLYRAHRWVDGQPEQATVRQAVELLAGIHVAGRPRLQGTPDTRWNGDRWGDALGQLARRVAGHPSRTLVVDSHRDLDRKNTLRSSDGRVLAVDWDAAGPISAIHEVVGLALDWADQDVDAFRAAIVTYEQHSRLTVPAEPWIFGGWVAAQGGWLDYNADNSRDYGSADQNREQRSAERDRDNCGADHVHVDRSAERGRDGRDGRDDRGADHVHVDRNAHHKRDHCDTDTDPVRVGWNIVVGLSDANRARGDGGGDRTSGNGNADRDSDANRARNGRNRDRGRADSDPDRGGTGNNADERSRDGRDADERSRDGRDADERSRDGGTADERSPKGQVTATRARLDQLAETLDDLLIRLARRPARPVS